AYWCKRPNPLAVSADAKDDEASVLAILRWLIVRQYTSRNESMGFERKSAFFSLRSHSDHRIPFLESACFNIDPRILIDQLFTDFSRPDGNNRGRTALLVEQASHYPPITTYAIGNKSKGLKLVSHNAQKTSLSYEKLGKLTKPTPPEKDCYELLVDWPESLAN
ncbi:Protein KES1, partial [Leucoagaricus sp. SymC.cos]